MVRKSLPLKGTTRVLVARFFTRAVMWTNTFPGCATLPPSRVGNEIFVTVTWAGKGLAVVPDAVRPSFTVIVALAPLTGGDGAAGATLAALPTVAATTAPPTMACSRRDMRLPPYR